MDQELDHGVGIRLIRKVGDLVGAGDAVAIVEAQRSQLIQENRELRDKLKPSPGMERIVTQSREMTNILSLLAKVGDSSATVLFMGETGTGKGLLAQVVHEISIRRDRPFVQVNCAALPEQLLESELFGYVHGAFTGALRDKTGLFEEAEGGTIFLDEIEKVPETVQAKLLHVLDRGEIRPVGATRNRRPSRSSSAIEAAFRERTPGTDELFGLRVLTLLLTGQTRKQTHCWPRLDSCSSTTIIELSRPP